MRKLTKIIKKRRKNYKPVVGIITSWGAKECVTWNDYITHRARM